MATTETNTTHTTETATRQVEKLLSALAERVSAEFTASKVFGAPVERDGVTVVPVAAAHFGFGGGGGADPRKEADGAGAGAAGMMAAAGYIEIKDGGSRFVPVVHPRANARVDLSHDRRRAADHPSHEPAAARGRAALAMSSTLPAPLKPTTRRPV